ncbi:MAG: hypothetical protein KQA41_02245 [Candidatus Aenigmarchaeota archaeon]|nr:hypothetical protein [Candidatus Aenigmarchaeota archaeon]MBU5689022.1 hypothetical protein [Candidatus Aenigmarchaeota archaeon]
MGEKRLLRICAVIFLAATMTFHQINQKYFHIPYSVIPDTVEALIDPSVPKIFLPPFYCAGYALTAAEIRGWGGYYFADAWHLASQNQVLWQGTAKNLKELNFEPPEGSIIGIYNPNSRYNQEGRLLTHVAFYIGKGYIIHQYGPFILKSRIDKFLKETQGEIRVIIVPPQQKAKNKITYKPIFPFLRGFYFVDY